MERKGEREGGCGEGVCGEGGCGEGEREGEIVWRGRMRGGTPLTLSLNLYLKISQMGFCGFHSGSRQLLSVQPCSGGVHPMEELSHCLVELSKLKQCALQTVLATQPFRIDFMPQGVHLVQLVRYIGTVISSTTALEGFPFASNIVHSGYQCLETFLKLLCLGTSFVVRLSTWKATPYPVLFHLGLDSL